MKIAVLRFPGSNCDQDCVYALGKLVPAAFVWHKETSLEGFDGVVVPGGFSYGDYLRCGAIARFSPIMQALGTFADNGGPVIGICNGFQILCEAGLLPGALVRNRSLHFICRYLHIRVEQSRAPFTSRASAGSVLHIPIAHGEGNYVVDDATLNELNAAGRVVFRYCDVNGQAGPDSNPNGSIENIAGVTNKAGNVLGMMPHPERACENLLGGTDGNLIFQSMIDHIQARATCAA